MNLGSDVVITITGIVLVFAILILLMLIITLEGKIFDGMAAKKKAAKEPAAPRLPQSPLPPCSRLLPPLWWRKASPAMWLPQLWLPSMPWAMVSTP